MGQMLTGLLKEDPEAEVAAGVDGYTGIANEYPVFASIDECDVPADVVIDFSNAKAADGLLDYCVRTKTPVVLCTTGLSEEQLAKVEEAAKETAVLKSANMSLGINLLMKLLKQLRLWRQQVLIWRLLRSITTRSWTHPAAPHWHWQTPSMRHLTEHITMYMTEARSVRSAKAAKSVSLLFVAAPSWVIMT